MPIPLACACGRSFRIKDDLAGRKVRCPDCADVLVVPNLNQKPIVKAPPNAPAISLTCGCGRTLRVKESVAGRKVRCPTCSNVLLVPQLPQRTDGEAEAYGLLAADSPRQEQAPQPYPVSKAPPAEFTLSRPPMPAPPRPIARPKRPRERSSRPPRVAFGRGWFGSVNSGFVGGLLMMLIAVVWFLAGLSAGIIFFYPPVLLVIGFIAMAKGLTGGD